MRGLLARVARNLARPAETGTTTRVAALLAQAQAHVAAQRSDAAHAVCLEALALDPGSFDVLLMLGVLEHGRGRLAEAIELLRRASEARPDDIRPHAYVALACQALQRWEESRAAIAAALAINPDWDEAHNLLGVTLQRLGDDAGARRAFERAVALNGRNSEALNNLANVRNSAGEVDDAVKLYRRALEQRPDSVLLLNNLGLALQQAGQLADAQACFERVVEREPDNADGHTNLGVVRQVREDASGAEASFRAAAVADPRSARAHANLALVLAERGAADDAAEHCRAAFAQDPREPEILCALAQVEKLGGRLDTAEVLCRRGLRGSPRHVELTTTLGTILTAGGKLADADACFSDALEANPSFVPARYNRATLALLRGDYRLGFALYESRFEAFAAHAHRYGSLAASFDAAKCWQGEPLSGRRLLLFAEQGYGDAIMMMRYAPLLKATGAARVAVYCDPALVRLMAAVQGVDEVIPDSQTVASDAFDLHCPLMSLPYALGTDTASVPPPPPMRLDAGQVASWRARLGDDERPRVGLVWRGSAVLREDHLRNVPFGLLADALADASRRYCSLQKPRDEAARGAALTDWMDDCHDFLDTAALIENLDLVIAVDTAVAHLAGTLGKEVWLLNRHGSEWRWGLDAECSIWYPRMRIFRQETYGDWRETLARVQVALSSWTKR
jgi:tetratricopeptide (TPR) repeat protein